MPDYRTFFEREHIGAWDLNGKDKVVTIKNVVAGKVGHDKRATKKPILTIADSRGNEKTLPSNITNAKAIAAMYGNDVSAWTGKKITIYPTTTTFGSETVDCIRVRPRAPDSKATVDGFEQVDPAVKAEMMARQDRAAGREPNRAEGELSAEEEERLSKANAG